MKKLLFLLLLSAQTAVIAVAQSNRASSTSANRVKIINGILEGTTEKSGVRTFKGIPFAAAPVGALRWREPHPVKNWSGVRKADKFGPRAMQRDIFGDMNFRADGMSEDCLYLNVWTPAKTNKERLPVLVYFYGGGFMAGDGSEPRYDGESMAQKGIVTLTVNYRLGVYGFFAHPELTEESPNNASGNYGLMDQAAALQWVKQNIAAFGGDPEKVTIAGESAGSFSVSAQMASPLSKKLIAGAIGESGSLLSLQPLTSLEQAEEIGVKFANMVRANSLKALRAMPAKQLLEATANPEAPRFSAIVDGYFLPKSPEAIFQAGEQAQVPLLAGWNSEEMNYRALMGQLQPTPENYKKTVQNLYGNKADEALRLYPGSTEEEVIQSATDLAGDRFIGYSTWKLIDMHAKTSNKPVFRYYYTRPRPAMVPEMGDAAPGLAGGVVRGNDPSAVKIAPSQGAVHSAEIEYAMGNLSSNKVYAWTPDDYKVSQVMQDYFANFIKTINPNGAGLPQWPAANTGDKVQVMHIDVKSEVKPDETRDRYLFLESATGK
ncbi:carboxylesterase/lipase family protein [Pontibacter harenae]|uniref:carboxylesterase/lipase family protein n=1 Tax=Pontibacter harenae TaxID=2894083 RepID=UPI001E29F392|nr:carboxylesterase family protein [Pontibacter harenae]MCC9167284.1 carboxylesterase family protein [Pontibacter harenae]